MKKLVECVPNFSEGKDLGKVAQITDEIRKTAGVKLLNVESNPDHNRTVITFVGNPESVKKAAFLAIVRSAQVIDMSLHKGEHPRIGACDVCPFVPLRGVTMEECVSLARELGREVAQQLNIPIFLYEEAATSPKRKNLPTIREGEYEGLEEKLCDPEWQPDFGPAIFNPKSGAMVIGARFFLIAYNINLDTSNLRVAQSIAAIIRESGKKVKYGKHRIKVPGVLKSIQARCLPLEEYSNDVVQVSINLTNFKVASLHMVFETVRQLT